MTRSISKVAVLDRGDAALRLLRALHDFRRERGLALTTLVLEHGRRRVALARDADQVLALDPIVTADPARLVAALVRDGVDAVFPGWGDPASHAALAEACAAAEVTFIGPSAEALGRLPGFVTPREGERRIEVLVAMDHAGAAAVCGVIDTSACRDGDVVLAEYDPRPEADALGPEAIARARDAGLVGVVAVVFLVPSTAGAPPAYLGITPCLPATHMLVHGLDLATLQLELALGGALPPLHGVGQRHTVAVRLAVEVASEPMRAGAEVALVRVPTGPGIRVDLALEPGDVLLPGDDPVLLRIVAGGRDRAEAHARLRRAVSELAVVVQGGASDKDFVLRLLARPELEQRTLTLSSFGAVAAELAAPSREHRAVALVTAAIDAYEVHLEAELARFLTSSERGRPETRSDIGLGLELREAGSRAGLHQLHVERLGRDRFRVRIDKLLVDVERRRLGPYEARLSFPMPSLARAQNYRVVVARQGSRRVRVEVEGVPHVLERDPHRTVVAPAPAVVARVDCVVGQRVAEGERLLTLEAMKLEMPVLSPCAGRVRGVRAIANEQVPPGTPLVVVEPEGEGGSEPALAPAAPQRDGVAAVADELRALSIDAARPSLAETHRDALALLTGYDVTPAAAQALVAARKALAKALAPDDPALLESEDELLRVFADIQSLFRRRAPSDLSDEGHDRSAQEYLFLYLRTRDIAHAGLPAAFVDKLRTALAHLGVRPRGKAEHDGDAGDAALTEALYGLVRARHRLESQASPVAQILERRLAARIGATPSSDPAVLRDTLERIALVTRTALPGVADLARLLKHVAFDEPLVTHGRDAAFAAMEAHLAALGGNLTPAERDHHVRELVACPHPLTRLLNQRFAEATPEARLVYLEVVLRRYYRIRDLMEVHTLRRGEREIASAHYEHEGRRIEVRTTFAPFVALGAALATLAAEAQRIPLADDVVLDLVLGVPPQGPSASDPAAGGLAGDSMAEHLAEALARAGFGRPIRRVVVMLPPRGGEPSHFTFRPAPGRFVEDRVYRGLHPMMGKRLELWRLSGFDLERLASAEEVYLFRARSHENPKDERFLALAEIRDLTPVRDADGRIVGLPHLEQRLGEAFQAIRQHNVRRPPSERLFWNRVYLYVRAPFDIALEDMARVARRLASDSEGLGLEKVVARVRLVDPATGEPKDAILEMDNPNGTDLALRVREPGVAPLRPLSEYAQKVIRARQLGLTHPFEILRMLTPEHTQDAGEFPPGTFVEYDVAVGGTHLEPVSRGPGLNSANLVVGIVTNFTAKYPEGVRRVVMLGDPLHAMGSIAEPECRRLVLALDLAAELRVPVEWYAVCAGARIAMDTGTENLDWTARGIRKLIEHTQAGHEVNVVVCGINVGAQSYWNSEATMLNHTKGVLIMVPSGAMVLTGKLALDYSGSVSAEDNFGIGGYEHIMGPNGEAQYWARDIREACKLLLQHYDFAYLHPGERFPRRAATSDPLARDVSSSPHAPEPGIPFRTIGEVLSPATNPERKLPYAVREVMRAVFDRDHPTLERWGAMVDAEVAVVWDGHLGGYPVCMIGIESKPLPRTGWVPADGPQEFTAATLFPQSSKKIARAINACSGNRPIVILANLSGFDGSPESMRKRQLEYGAEIARSVVNFKGPIVFCVVARYHGGAYVVFSNRLQDEVEVAALEGTYASVIGGAPAAAVVFAGEVKKRTAKDARVAALQKQIEAAPESERAPLRRQLAETTALVRSEKLGEVAVEFDGVHTVKRAREVGSIDALVPPERLRPYLIEAVERGIRRTLGAT